MSMDKESVWVWFKGGEKGGFWMGGFKASKSPEGGIKIERPDFISCRVPEWRISTTEPSSKNKGPEIPIGAKWKLV